VLQVGVCNKISCSDVTDDQCVVNIPEGAWEMIRHHYLHEYLWSLTHRFERGFHSSVDKHFTHTIIV